jgi:hypothetical protein
MAPITKMRIHRVGGKEVLQPDEVEPSLIAIARKELPGCQTVEEPSEALPIDLRHLPKQEGLDDEISGFQLRTYAPGDAGACAIHWRKDRREFRLGRGTDNGGLREGGCH